MPLVDIWKASELRDKRIQQILGLAGDGKLRDGNITSEEFREFLAHVPSEKLMLYAAQCLEQAFPESGLALQDIVNQLGKRLGFSVEAGRYRGVSNEPGHDGLWRTKQGEVIIVEVKTTDAYRLSLEVAAGYRKRLIRDEAIEEEKVSILYVVGRSDTGDLEAQVRGSRHAWDIRIISIDALLRLVRVKEELATQETIDRIRDILIPREYTRVDGIIDLVFSATTEAKDEEASEGADESGAPDEETERKFTPVKFREACIPRLEAELGDTLVKQSLAIFAVPSGKVAVFCAISREYVDPAGTSYWYAFHPSQKAALEDYDTSWVSFACGSERQIFLIPFRQFTQWLPSLNKTESNDRDYWHVKIYRRDDEWTLKTRRGKRDVGLGEFYLPAS